ncbi:MAG: hypothetical protein RBS39_12910 [Phycisphaerales bacterium]|jgi:hypothetical protein|nr:hypothetical protein [Phycisphaerales bacterium]
MKELASPKPDMWFRPQSLRRLSDSHTKLNESAKVIGIALKLMEQWSHRAPSRAEVLDVVAEASSFWRGNIPFKDVGEAARATRAHTAKLLLVASTAAFEDFVQQFRKEHNRASANHRTNRASAHSIKVPSTPSALVKKFAQLWKDTANRQIAAEGTDQLVCVANAFVHVRHEVAHKPDGATWDKAKGVLDLNETKTAWETVGGPGTLGQIPHLPTATQEGMVSSIDLPHSVLASVVFHRLASELCCHSMRIDPDRRALSFAVNEVVFAEDLPAEPEARITKLNSVLTNGQYPKWSRRQIRAALEDHGLLDKLLNGPVSA